MLQKKHFPTNIPINEKQELGYKVVDIIIDYLSDINDRKTYSGKSYKELKETSFKNINDIIGDLLCFNGKCLSHMITLSPFMPILVNSVIDAMNFDLSDDNIPDFIRKIEDQTVNWLAEMMGYKREVGSDSFSGGIITNGGTIANLMAFLVIRNKYLSSRGIDLTRDGLLSLPENENLTIFISKEAHYSLKKIGGYVGIGTDNVVGVEVDDNFKMDIQDLKSKISQAKKEGKILLGIIANAGSTSTGAIDPIKEISAIAKTHNLWLHADSAHGGGCALTQRHEKLKKSIHEMRLADSITVDPHKFLHTPCNGGSFLVKDRSNLRFIKGVENIKLAGKTVQKAKRFDALKLWTSLQFMGTENLSKLVDYSIDMTAYFYELFENAEDFENINVPDMNIFIFRYVPKHLKEELNKAVAEKNINKINSVNEQLNKFTAKIQDALHKDGNFRLSYTKVKKTNIDLSVLRVVVMNVFVTPQKLDEFFLAIRKTAEKIAGVKEHISEFPQRISLSKDVIASAASFRKYFATPENREEVRQAGKTLIDIILRKLDVKKIDLDLQKSAPKEPSSLEHVLSILQTIYEDACKYNKEEVSFLAILGAPLSAAFNQNQLAFELAPGTTVIENRLVEELTKRFGYKSFLAQEGNSGVWVKPGGIVTNCLSFSLLTMLLVARNKLLQQKQKDTKDVTEIGLQVAAQHDDLVFITSKSQESIMKDLANVLGFGPQKVIAIDEINGNTNINLLQEKILELKKQNKTIIALDVFVSNEKEFDTKNFTELCKREKIFLNVTSI